MHNKFIILVEDGTPTQVLTGSTNFTDGGIYGQSNVGHIVRDIDIAGRYMSYWNALSRDPPGRSMRAHSDDGSDANSSSSSENEDPAIDFEPDNGGHLVSEYLATIKEESTCNKKESMVDFNEADEPDLDGPFASVLFSPRRTTSMLQYYADRMADATTSIHLTAPFGVSQQFGKVLNKAKKTRATNTPSNQDGLRRSPRLAKRNSCQGDVSQPDSSLLLRYVLFDKKPSEQSSQKARSNALKKGKDYVDYFDFKDVQENKIAYGAVLTGDENGVQEDLTGLTSFVDFVHLKCMLIDATSDRPTVITGSANFSEASTLKNDENMLVIHGDCAVADVYLTEYMRLFNHFFSRDHHEDPKDSTTQKKKSFGWGQLANDESWLQPYFDPTNQLYRERLLMH
jgi:phosphatidylserine/phosphatidylglycerophosphate/cardiolipin synthase-like enzyme